MPNIKVITILLAITVIYGCASAPNSRSVRVEERRIAIIEEQKPTPMADPEDGIATPLKDRNYHIEQAEYYQNLAADKNAQLQSVDAALSAAEFYIQAEDLRGAQRSIENLDTRPFTDLQRSRYEIILAYGEYARQEYRVAANRLNRLLNRAEMQTDQASRQRVDALLLSSFCFQSLDEYDTAIAVLIERESLLFGAARAETSRYIWQIMDGLSFDQRQHIIQFTRNPGVRNRFEQSMQGQVNGSSALPNQFEQWRSAPAYSAQNIIAGQWSANSPRSIAVLLPITSRFNRAAQALIDGIQYQHSLNTSVYKPQIVVYDVGDNPRQIGQYYAAARQNGADLIIGPLGKNYANEVLNSAYLSLGVPVILLGGDSTLRPGISRLTMSPERQGEIVAKQALARGYVNAGLLVPDNNTGRRTANAFSQAWLASGGKLSKSINYSPKQFDHTTELKQLFDINQSEYRFNRLSKTLGIKPKFSAYRRNDIDFIFMIADTAAGRIVRPQINFFGGTSLPVLATSSIYNGIQDPTNNTDLDHTAFPVMPWVLISNDVAPYAGQLNMLFAMGTDAYRVAGNLASLRSNSSTALDGNMGTLSIEPDGTIRYQPIWARFKDGLVETSTQLEYLSKPPDNQNSQRGEKNGTSNYNESNWDRRQSRRKTGT